MYYANYFDYLDIPNYSYWESAEHNRDSALTRVFENDRIGLVSIGRFYENNEVFNEWITEWKSRSGINIVQAAYEDKYVKRDYQNFMMALRNTNDIVEVNLAHFD